MGEIGIVHLPAAISGSLTVQQIDQRQCTVVVAVENGYLFVALRRCMRQPCVLGGTVCCRNQPDVCTGGPGGMDGFGMARMVFR